MKLKIAPPKSHKILCDPRWWHSGKNRRGHWWHPTVPCECAAMFQGWGFQTGVSQCPSLETLPPEGAEQHLQWCQHSCDCAGAGRKETSLQASPYLRNASGCDLDTLPEPLGSLKKAPFPRCQHDCRNAGTATSPSRQILNRVPSLLLFSQPPCEVGWEPLHYSGFLLIPRPTEVSLTSEKSQDGIILKLDLGDWSSNQLRPGHLISTWKCLANQ